MSQDELEGDWKKLSGYLKKQFGKISDNDLQQVDGSREKLVGLLQEKYGYAKRKAEEELENFLNDSADELKNLKGKAKVALNNFSEDMSENMDQVKEYAKEYSGRAKEYIQAAPLKSLLIATGIGILLGGFLSK